MRTMIGGFLLAAGAAAWQHPLDQAAMQKYEARATVVSGQVSCTRDALPWAVSAGERVPVRQAITTGRDGFAHFEVAGGASFDIFPNSRAVFRQNADSAGDLLDVLEGRVRVHLKPQAEFPQQRIQTPSAWIAATQNAVVTIALDEDAAMRVDVLEGVVKVQHRLLPRGEPTIVRAVDAILVQEDRQISRRLDRGSLYRYAVKPLHNLWSAVTPGRAAKSADPIEGNRFLSRLSPGVGPLQ